MTLIVEDGSQVPGAESYIAVADADAYFANRANQVWQYLDTPTKEAALRCATDYMIEIYRDRWAGVRASTTQPLDWPRFGVFLNDLVGWYGTFGYGYASNVASDVVPPEVSRACAELAVRAIDANGNVTMLAPDLDRATHSEKVGSLEVVYEPGSPQYRRYRAVDRLLGPFLANGTAGLSLTRA